MRLLNFREKFLFNVGKFHKWIKKFVSNFFLDLIPRFGFSTVANLTKNHSVLDPRIDFATCHCHCLSF